MEVIKEEGTWPNLMLSHIKSLLLYIYIVSHISLSHISYPDIRKGKKKIIGGSVGDLMMIGKWPDRWS